MFFKILLSCCLAFSLFAAEVEITAKRFDGDDKSGVSKFSGNVKVVKEGDTIYSDTLFVYTDAARKPHKFEAIGNASFVMIQEGNKTYKGKARTITYFPNQKEYLLVGDGYVEYVEEKRKVFGDRIFVNDVTKKATVVGEEGGKPAKFIFFIEDKNSSKKTK
ncbi:MAG TPA: lipopolysaccharide transport periplasmic protein LptA [Campylobacterales bacterium]|nr:lipopolysaccharide transport periplasmic protein LptA [Campylobacterales bacterium]